MGGMTEKYAPKKGDRVRVVLEGEVVMAGDHFEIGLRDSNYIVPEAEHVASIEKLAPPVVTFGPGDTVRRKGSGALYSIGRSGYFSHQSHTYERSCVFTSEHYDRVDLA